VFELPLLFPNSKVGSRVVWEMFEKEPSLRAEFPEVKVLWLHTVTPMQLHTIKKPIRCLEDLKGMKIRSVGGVAPSVLKALGAVPVVMPTPDVYVALERGTVDGTIGAWEQLEPFRFQEVTKYHTTVNLWVGQFYVVMNSKRWESLPPDIQKTIDEISGARGTDLAGSAWDKVDMRGLEMVRGLSGHEVIILSHDELARWRKAIMPIWDEWVADKEAKGLPGRKILDEVLRLTEKYTK
jgi:TRAP-type C4-dicarboxylate transport system substrate-binding protein